MRPVEPAQPAGKRTGAAGSAREKKHEQALARVVRQARLTAGFFTVLPFSASGSLEEVAQAGYLLPVVGALLGGIEGLVAWGSLRLFGSLTAAAVVLAVALLLTGLHHMDGLVDLGDAAMIRGSASRRLESLKDRTAGTGAAGAVLLTYLITWTALAGLAELRPGAAIVSFLIAAEVCARMGLVIAAQASRPSHPGSGSVFIDSFKGGAGFAALAAAAVILVLVAIPAGLPPVAASAAGAALTAVLIAAAARRLFGGANGDVLGATVELARMMSLLAIVLAIKISI